MSGFTDFLSGIGEVAEGVGSVFTGGASDGGGHSDEPNYKDALAGDLTQDSNDPGVRANSGDGAVVGPDETPHWLAVGEMI